MAGTLLNIGHGYSARAFAASLSGDWRVLATARSPEAAERLASCGVEAVDWHSPASVANALARASHLLVSAPPGEDGDPVLNRHGAALAGADLEWVGYLSTTGVYGDRQGGWVTEQSPLAPVNARSRRRAAAEAAWLGLAKAGLPVHVFRLAGIYGPGRSALDRLREGRAHRVVKPGQVFSRIHVEDIAATLRASVRQPQPGRIFNLADDEPAPPEEVIAYAAGLLGLDVPPAVPFETAPLSPMARSFYAESKRVANGRIKAELGVRLLHPTYREGLRAVLAAGG